MIKKLVVIVSAVLIFSFMGLPLALSNTIIRNISPASRIENPYLSVHPAIKNMYNPSRFPDLYLLTQPHCLFTKRSEYDKISKGEKPKTVTNHGSPWNYDTDVPIIFFGKGIKQGYLGGEAHLIDIAPTLAYLTGVQRPSAARGRVLHEIIDPKSGTWDSNERPKVVVLFSLDQARTDYLNVFEDAFSFLKKKIISNGATFVQGRITYAKTATAVSHSSVGTGTIPGIHGVLGNNVMLPDGSFPLTIDDGNRTDYGHGDLSPHNLLVSTFADELDRRYNNRSIVISSSSYARAAIGIAGHGAFYKDGDYVFPGADKDIVFSCNRYAGVPYTNTDYYRLPDYLNAEKNPDINVKQWLKNHYNLDIETTMWTHDLTLFDKSPYFASRKHVGNASASFSWGESYRFSHPIVKKGEAEPDKLQRYADYKKGVTRLSKKYYETTLTPFFDLWNTDLNLMIMEKESVGKDKVPDFVFFHIKSLDIVGHNYGVYSGEIYNYMYFADYMIKKVIKWLDKNVGKGHYTCVFFSDHGATNVITNGQWIVQEDMIKAMEAQFGKGIIRKLAGDQIWLDKKVLDHTGVTTAVVARWMEDNFKWLMRAYTKEDVAN